MRHLLKLLPLLLLAAALPSASHAQNPNVIAGQACGAPGASDIATNGQAVRCQGSPLTWTATGGGVSSVSALPGTCTPGVTANVQGSVAITISGTTYAAGTEFWCSAVNTWSPVSVGQTPGTFTSAQMSTPFLFATNQGTDSPLNIANQGGTTFKLNDAVSAIAVIPTTGVTNAFTNGMAAYVHNSNPNATGQNGWVGGVGMFGLAWCDGGSNVNTRCWGSNFGASDAVGKPAFLYGNEYDLVSNNTTTQGYGTIWVMNGNGQPGADTFPAANVRPAIGTARFTSGYRCESGSLALGATLPYACLNLLPFETGNNQDSNFLWFTARNASASINMSLHLLQDNFAIFGSTATSNSPISVALDATNTSTGSAAEWGITLKATAALSVNTLVKIDTANADSAVICTTADTQCDGFVMGGAVYCTAGNQHCGINMTTGSKAVGILGTGTCAIGNFVIVDTTTNGRIKCQAAIPAQGAYIGKALSAQSTVGNTVDILTKFQ